MLYEAEGLMHSQLNANQCLCCINTFFSRHGDPTRPEAEGLIAILNLLISLPFIQESIDDQTDHQWQLLQVVEGASKKKPSKMLHGSFTDSHRLLSKPDESIDLPLRFESEELLNRFILCNWIASNSMSISWICVFGLNSRLSNSFDSIDQSCYMRYCRIADNCFLNTKAIF